MNALPASTFAIPLLVAALVVALIALLYFRTYRRLSRPLNRAHEMTGRATGTISDVVTVRRRNNSFRWKNEYPVVSYQAEGRTYTTELSFAEARRGKYSLGGAYTVRYVPEDPSCCVVEEFRSKMQRSRTQALIIVVILAVFTFNIAFSAISSLLL